MCGPVKYPPFLKGHAITSPHPQEAGSCRLSALYVPKLLRCCGFGSSCGWLFRVAEVKAELYSDYCNKVLNQADYLSILWKGSQPD